MEKYELEQAIAGGIFWGVFSVLVLLFVLWLFSPLLIPLAFTFQAYAVEKWRLILSGLFAGAAIFIVLWGLREYLTSSPVGQWFKERLSAGKDTPSTLRCLLLVAGVGSGFWFIALTNASRTMRRDFEVADAALLGGLLLVSFLSNYFALRKPRVPADNL